MHATNKPCRVQFGHILRHDIELPQFLLHLINLRQTRLVYAIRSSFAAASALKFQIASSPSFCRYGLVMSCGQLRGTIGWALSIVEIGWLVNIGVLWLTLCLLRRWKTPGWPASHVSGL